MKHSHRVAPAILQQKKIGETFAYCLIFISQAGNAVIEMIVYMHYKMTK